MKKSLLLCVVLCLVCVNTVFAGRHRRSSNGSTSAPVSEPMPAEPQKDFDLKEAEEVEKELLVAINAERQRYGLAALIMDHRLQQQARRHCKWMVDARSMVHSGDPCAENIAMGQPSIFGVVRAWMNSSGHRANILNGGNLRTGVACYKTPNGTLYWCQQFRR